MAGDEKDKEKARSAAEGPKKMDRRDLLLGLSTVPALGLFGYAWQKQRQYERAAREAAAAPQQAAATDVQTVNVALIGAGAQGQVLTDAMLRIPGLRFRAVCDVWTEYNQRRVVNMLSRFKHEANAYEDYREMLDKEKGARRGRSSPRRTSGTPSTRSPASRRACTSTARRRCPTRSTTPAGWSRPPERRASSSRSATSAAATRATCFCYEKLLGEAEAARPDHDGQRPVEPRARRTRWAARRATRSPRPARRSTAYGSMHQFRNWRWYKGLGGGPIVDLGSHQIDIYNWFLGARPDARDGQRRAPTTTTRTRTSGTTRSWRSTSTTRRQARARVLPDASRPTAARGYFEMFMGDEGTLLISESG